MAELSFTLPTGELIQPEITNLFMAGYTGRDAEFVKRHIAEMAERGVSPPSKTPAYHSVMTCLLTQGEQVQVSGLDTLPEVEFVVFSWEGQLFVTVGNDQYDIEMEKTGHLQHSKNLGQKPIGKVAWPFESVRGHWDELYLEMRAGDILLQKGVVGEILRPEVLVASASMAVSGTMVFSGTVPFIAALDRDARKFSIALIDPVRSTAIMHDFLIDVLK